MSTENDVSEENNSELDDVEDAKQDDRRRSTTVIMTMNVTTVPATESEGVRRNGSVRRRLSKQNATIEEVSNFKGRWEIVPRSVGLRIWVPLLM